MKLRTILTALVIMGPMLTWAIQGPPSTNSIPMSCAPFPVGCVLNLQETKWGEMTTIPSANWEFVNLENKAKTFLYIDRNSHKHLTGAFTYSVDLQINYHDEANAIAIQQGGAPAYKSPNPPIVTLTVSYDPASGAIETDKDAFLFSDAYDVQITVVNKVFNCPSGLVTLQQAESIIWLQADITVDRKIELASMPSIPDQITYASIASPGHVGINWANQGAEAYDIEWTWVDENLPGTHNIVFRNNATRVRVAGDATQLEVPIIYGKGYLVFRIRGIFLCGPNHEHECPGDWSYDDLIHAYDLASILPTPGCPPSCANYPPVHPDFFVISDDFIPPHETNLNWTSSLSLAEDGKMKVVISYADGTFRNRQVITRVNSSGDVIVGESIYDHAGRASINVLPVPGGLNLGYYPNFNRNSAEEPYTWRDFELAASCNVPEPDPMSSTFSGASQYYSANNPDKSGFNAYIPNAHEYPFTATQFYGDGSGRVYKESGVGYSHRIGSGHETEYAYEQPTQQELDRVFGIDVGPASNYVKTRTIDANGQASVSYMDKYGRVIATALSGQAPGNVDALPEDLDYPHKDDSPKDVGGVDFMLNNKVSYTSTSNSSSLTYDLPVEQDGHFAFNYELQPELWTHDCEFISNICYDCIYGFKVTIIDKATRCEVYNHTQTFGAANYYSTEHENTCSRVVDLVQLALEDDDLVNPGIELTEGNYTVEKTLYVSEDAAAHYAKKYVEDIISNHEARIAANAANETCFTPYETFLEEEMTQLDFDGCGYSCEECLEQWENMSAGTAKDEQKALCDYLCNTDKVNCESLRQSLLRDMKPGGQYAQYYNLVEVTDGQGNVTDRKLEMADFYDGSGYSENQLSILNVKNLLPSIRYHDGSSWVEDHQFNWKTPFGGEYKDADGNTAYVQYKGRSVKPTELPLPEFIRLFEDPWAEALLPFHPEYAYLVYCETLESSGSNDFETLMLTTESYADACDAGLFNPLNLTSPEDANVGVPVPMRGTPATDDEDDFFSTQSLYGPQGGSDQFYREQMLHKLSEFMVDEHGNTYSMWEVAWIMGTCPGANDLTKLSACLDPDIHSLVPACTSVATGCDLAEYNAVWEYFRDFYLSAKQEVVNMARDEYAMLHTSYNGCIGMTADDFKNYRYMRLRIRTLSSNRLSDPSYHMTPFYGNYFFEADYRQPCALYSSRLELFASKAKRFGGDAFALIGLSAEAVDKPEILIQELSDEAEAQLTDQCDDACNSHVENWMAVVDGCLDHSASGYQALYDDIKAEIKDLCMSGCDLDHPLGVASYPPGNANGYSTIAEILEDKGVASCDISQIIEPDYSDFGGEGGVFLDECGCEKLSGIQEQFNNQSACSTLPTGVLTASDLLNHVYGIELTEAQFQKLACACTGYSSPQWLKAQKIHVPSELTCDKCFSCETVSNVAFAFETKHAATFASNGGAFDYDLLSVIQRQELSELFRVHSGVRISDFQIAEMIDCCYDNCEINSDPTQGPVDEIVHWFNFLNELVSTVSKPSSFLVAKANGDETTNSLTPAVDYGSYIVDVLGNPPCTNYEITTALKGGGSVTSSTTALQQHQGMYGLIKNSCDKYCMFTLAFESHLGGSPNKLFANSDYEDIVEFVSYRVKPGYGANTFFVTAKMTDGTHRVLQMQVHCFNYVSATDTYSEDGRELFEDCEGYDSSTDVDIPEVTYNVEWESLENGNNSIPWPISRTPQSLLDIVSTIEIPGNISISSPLYEAYATAYLNTHSLEVDLHKTECDDCECGEGQLIICDQINIRGGQLKNLLQKLSYVGGQSNNRYKNSSPIAFTLNGGSGISELTDHIVPDDCTPTPTTMNYTYNSANSANGNLNATLDFGTCSAVDLSLYSGISTFDFANIEQVLNIKTHPKGEGDIHDYKFSIEIKVPSPGYCVDGVNGTTQFWIHGYADGLDLTDCNTENYFCARERKTPLAFRDPCYERLINIAETNAKRRYNGYILELENNFRMKYLSQCLINNNSEKFTSTITTGLHHYTLFYHDQAGNLVRTVPPQGVDFLDATELSTMESYRTGTGSGVRPNHTYQTHYNYGGLNESYWQSTPDGGESRFYFDELHRLALSQNDKQKNAHAGSANEDFSYTLYDPLSRIVEVGQVTVDPTAITLTLGEPTTNASISSVLAGTKEQVTKTYYDEATTNSDVLTKMGGSQENLIFRVAYSKYRDDGVPDNTDYDHATYYNYDILGNVNTLIQENPDLAPIDHDLKRMDYSYDLVSGNVNEVWYQHGEADRYYHRYSYDADNRITETYISKDYVFWTEDARYEYYRHGALARTELGDLKVQGIDHAYTIQGWLKAINGNILQAANDMGEDGLSTGSHNWVARDAVGFALGYFDNTGTQNDDYTAISSTKQFMAAANHDPNNNGYKSLYNGNIGYMSVANSKLMATSTDAFTYIYQYDQLNRITKMQVDQGQVSNAWSGTLTDKYRTTYAYDKNGNITSLTRNGDLVAPNRQMDNLSYEYYTLNGLPSNRLKRVTETVAAGTYSNDFDPTSNDYEYDEIGNLTKDADEEIDAISWNANGKIKEVTRTTGSSKAHLEFRYDANGNRIVKLVKNGTTPLDWVATYYVRDAQGNVMATYKGKILEEPVAPYYKSRLTLKEQHVYGSSRLGILKRDIILYKEKFNGSLNADLFDYTVVSQTSLNTASVGSQTTQLVRGEARFELANHLGNVLAVISDRKISFDNVVIDGITDYYEADITSAQDYYPFGMEMPDRTYSNSVFSGDYRYAFNGMERDDEWSGAGNAYDFGARVYDSRIGRFLSIDPLEMQFPFSGPYVAFNDNPVYHTDSDGQSIDQQSLNPSERIYKKSLRQRYLKWRHDKHQKRRERKMTRLLQSGMSHDQIFDRYHHKKWYKPHKYDPHTGWINDAKGQNARPRIIRVTSKDVERKKLNSTHEVDLKARKGQLMFNHDAYTIPDKFRILDADGNVIYESKEQRGVGGTGNDNNKRYRGSKYISYDLTNASSTVVTIEVTSSATDAETNTAKEDGPGTTEWTWFLKVRPSYNNNDSSENRQRSWRITFKPRKRE